MIALTKRIGFLIATGLILAVGLWIVSTVYPRRQDERNLALRHNIMVGKIRVRFETFAAILPQIKQDMGAYPKSDETLSPLVLIKEGPFADSRMLKEDFQDPAIREKDSGYPQMFRYWSDGYSYVIFSAGSDRVYDIDKWRASSSISFADFAKKFREVVPQIIYDPTNGTMSSGDILASSIDLGFPSIKTLEIYQSNHRNR